MKGKKIRNIIRDANMRNFSRYTIERYMIIDDDSTENEKDKFIKDVNERLWSCIQEVNVRSIGLVLPYVIVRRVYRDGNNQIRIVINDIASTTPLDSLTDNVIDIHNLSHLINFRTATPQRKIMVSDDIIPGNAKMIIDKADQVSAAVDIFLDIAMFNACSFFRKLSFDKKINFSTLKYNFFKNSGEESYYLFSDANPPSYYSFAFSARTDDKTIDYSKYIDLWNAFISSNFALEKNEVLSVVEQLQYHRDLENLDQKYLDNKFWSDYKGDYLFLRINQEPSTKAERIKIVDYFGITEFNIGEIKPVPINEYFNPFIRKLINELILSAYKIVV